MIDLQAAMVRDSILQYLAMYKATKGLTVPADIDDIHKFFVEFKKRIIYGSYTLAWLAEKIMIEYGIPPDEQGEQIDSETPLMHIHPQNDPRLNTPPPSKTDHSTTATIPENERLKDMQNLQKLMGDIQGLAQKYNAPIIFRAMPKPSTPPEKKPRKKRLPTKPDAPL